MPSTGTAKVTLPTDQQILITRELDAPPHLVYRAWTTPELVERWWTGRHGTMLSVTIDLRVGGRWRYVLAAEGTEMAFHGEYREIVPGERLVNTEVFEVPGSGIGPDDDESAVLTTTSFVGVDGRTRLEQLVEAGSREVRDVVLGSGMEVGVQQQMDVLEELAASLADG